MCGIAGIFNLDRERSVNQNVLRSMCNAIRHRGPDDEGFYVDRNFGMGMRRLSIIDLDGGRQPIKNEDGTVWMVFNGEIYNFKELKRELSRNGHLFRSNSDGEVVVHLYEEYGDSFVQHLNGMFAIALWDKRNKRLILVRDRLGIKPLYYSQSKHGIIFGSELKTILCEPACEKEIDLQALHDYLAFNYIPGPKTIFRGIKKLLPGNILTVQGLRVSLASYWDVNFKGEPTPRLSEEDYATHLYQLLKEAVQSHLVSDVPLGVFLSGGLDSSAIVALMAQVSNQPIKTFSIGFEQKSFNELPFARQVAQRFSTDHHELVIRPDTVNLLPRLIESFDEPFADSSAIPVYYVSQLARTHVKTVLSGEGGDEVFAGYETYSAAKVAHLYRKLPGLLKKSILPAVVRHLPVSHKKVSFDYKAKRFIEGALLPPEKGHFWWKVIFSEDAKRKLYRIENGQIEDSFHVFRDYFSSCTSEDLLARLQYVDTKVYLPDDILVKTDRMSMANSLEVRVPFLDHRIVDWAAQIPSHLKLNGLSKKYILKKVMSSHLPKEIIQGKKRGFNVPVPGWLRGELREMVGDVLSPSRIQSLGFFNANYISRMIEDHQAMRVDYSRNIWGLLIFALWHDTYMREAPKAEYSQRRFPSAASLTA